MYDEQKQGLEQGDAVSECGEPDVHSGPLQCNLQPTAAALPPWTVEIEEKEENLKIETSHSFSFHASLYRTQPREELVYCRSGPRLWFG